MAGVTQNLGAADNCVGLPTAGDFLALQYLHRG